MGKTFCCVSMAALAACSGGGGVGETRSYDMSVSEVRSRLLAYDFKRGVFPNSPKLKPDVRRLEDGSLEWTVLDDSQNGNGWWCPLSVEPAGDEKRTRVVNQCKGLTASINNPLLDELVDATLTGRAPKFD